jgi:hypothetical protein
LKPGIVATASVFFNVKYNETLTDPDFAEFSQGPFQIRDLKSATSMKNAMNADHQALFTAYIRPFAKYPVLQQRVLTVLQALPSDVQLDFVEDPRFGVAIDNYEPGKGWSLWMPTPGLDGNSTRCVVLRPKLNSATEEFANYVIAHEFAHAFLRNGGWGEITDVEQAADALAASWGFHRPEQSGWALP